MPYRAPTSGNAKMRDVCILSLQELTCDNLARNLQRFEGGGLWLQANQAGDTQPRWHFILDLAGSKGGQTRALNLLALELQAGKNSSHGGPWTGQVAVRPL